MRKLAPHTRFGNYELERRLGSGGMAEVWLAYPLAPGHPSSRVVIKVMHEHLTTEHRVVELFLEEARLAQRLVHPNIVRVFEAGQVDDEWFMAMEYVDGIDLRSATVAHGGPLWPAMAAWLFAEAAAGLHAAHGLKTPSGAPLNLVHRDISPDNLMVDRQGRVRVLDFGVARAADTEHTTLTGSRKGKVRYMAPEYLVDHRASPATDVYALGASLFEVVTGHRPFEHAQGTADLHIAVATEQLPPANEVRPSLPEPLVAIIRHATHKDPRQRMGTAKAFERQLRTFLTHWPPPTPEQIGDEVRLWRQRLALERPTRREAGSFGQLETTEFIRVGPLDDDTTEPRGVPLRKGIEISSPNIVLAPELERGAVRTRGKPKKSNRAKRTPPRR